MTNRWRLCLALSALLAPAYYAAGAGFDRRGTWLDGDYAVQVTGLTSQNVKDAQAALEKLAGAKAVTIDAEKGAVKITMKDDLVLKQAVVAEALKPLGGRRRLRAAGGAGGRLVDDVQRRRWLRGA